MASAKFAGIDKALARMARFPSELAATVDAQLKQEVTDLAQAIERAVPVDTGTLRSTIRLIKNTRPLSYKVIAGGAATTVKVRQGVSDHDFARALKSGGAHGEYDYFRAVEFGHLTPEGKAVPARPFFFPTYRARKSGIRRRIAAAAKARLKTLFPG